MSQPAPASFDDLVLPLRRELFATALRLTRCRADAEDLVQDTLASAFAAWSRFIPGSSGRAWLHRILKNGFITGYRRRRRAGRLGHELRDDALRALHAGADRAEPRA